MKLKYFRKKGIQSDVILIDINDAVLNQTTFVKDGFTYILMEKDILPYLVYRYAKHLPIPIGNSNLTYNELFEKNPSMLIALIRDNNLQSEFEKDIQGMYKMYDELEQRVKQQDDYENGRLNY